MDSTNKHIPPRRRRWLRWVNILLAAYLIGGVTVFFLQRKIIFHPEPLAADQPYSFAEAHRDIMVELDKDYTMNTIQFTTRDSQPKGVILYFHGNLKNVGWYANQSDQFTVKGYEVWMPDYPGFGKSTGTITEQALYSFGLQLYNMARSKYAPEQIIIYGRSLGTGVAAWLASKKSCRHLVLETPYYSLTSLAAHYLPVYPAGTLIQFKIPTYKYLSIVNAPITILHGTNDKVIPYSNAVKLKEVLKPQDQFLTIQGGEHNNLSQYQEFTTTIQSVLAN